MTDQNLSRRIFVHGVSFVLAGLLFGFLVPIAPYPRLAVGAHLQFVMNGILIMVQGMALLTLSHQVGARSMTVMIVGVWATWAMALSQAVNAFWGTTQVLAVAGGAADARGGAAWQELVVAMANYASGVALVPAWILMLIGFVRRDPNSAEGPPEKPNT